MYAQLVETYRVIGESRYQLAELKLTWYRVPRYRPMDASAAEQLAADMERFIHSSALAQAATLHPSLSEHLTTLSQCWALVYPKIVDGIYSYPCERKIEDAFTGAQDWINIHLPRQTRAFRVVLQMLLVIMAAFGVLVIWLVGQWETARQEEQRRTRLTHAILDAQDNERRVIALDLHDDALQTLSAAKILLDRDLVAPEVSRLLADGIARLRDLAAGLSLYELDRIGLRSAVSALVDQYRQRHGLPVQFRAAGTDAVTVPLPRARHIYRIIQELLNNAHKHAGASEVLLSMVVSWPELIVHYQDDGVGMAAPASSRGLRLDRHPPGNNTIGMQGIAERARLIGATVQVDSRPGEGMRVNVVIPLGDS
ncbi:MAG: hypothetical protein EA403_01425 [Spirochaetaceae bacterium]|nr:MAG: hypothetical protein EA403_01425 [Spirochaetaceae bacterium]